MQNRAVMSRRFRRSGWSSMPKVVVQTASAGDASDVEFPSAAGIDRFTVCRRLEANGRQVARPMAMVVADYASPKFRYYILLVRCRSSHCGFLRPTTSTTRREFRSRRRLILETAERKLKCRHSGAHASSLMQDQTEISTGAVMEQTRWPLQRLNPSAARCGSGQNGLSAARCALRLIKVIYIMVCNIQSVYNVRILL